MLASGKCDKATIAAVGITNQRETVVLWDRLTGEPYYNAIVWCDTRTSAACAAIAAEGGGVDRFREKTGLPLSGYFSGLTWQWHCDCCSCHL